MKTPTVIAEKRPSVILQKTHLPKGLALVYDPEFQVPVFQGVEMICRMFLTALFAFLLLPTIAAAQQAEGPQAGTVVCLLYTSPSPRDATLSRMPSSA